MDKSVAIHESLSKSIAFYRERLEEIKLSQLDFLLDHFIFTPCQLGCVQVDLDVRYKYKLRGVSAALCRLETELVSAEQAFDLGLDKLRRLCLELQPKHSKRPSAVDRRVRLNFPKQFRALRTAYNRGVLAAEKRFSDYFNSFLDDLERDSQRQFRQILGGNCFYQPEDQS